MNFDVPVAPVVVTTILGLLAPYVIAPLNGILPFVTAAWQRKVLSVVVSIALAAVGLVAYYAFTGAPLPATPAEWVVFGALVVVVCQASYNLITKDLGARALEIKAGGDDETAKAASHVSRANGRHAKP